MTNAPFTKAAEAINLIYFLATLEFLTDVSFTQTRWREKERVPAFSCTQLSDPEMYTEIG